MTKGASVLLVTAVLLASAVPHAMGSKCSSFPLSPGDVTIELPGKTVSGRRRAPFPQTKGEELYPFIP